MIYKVVKEGKGGIVAQIVADSISEHGDRITTFELEYHRFIHAEVMTHRLFSRNAMSSRAVPVKILIEQVRTNPAMPIHWGKNKAGMQAIEECSEFIDMDFLLTEYEKLGVSLGKSAEQAWKIAANTTANIAEAFSEAGYHKQIVNRLLEPFQMMKVVLTATEFDNFFWLRLDPDAQPEIQELAKCMYEAMQESEPELLKEGEWHTPYVEHDRDIFKGGYVEYYVEDKSTKTHCRYLTLEEAKAISASCCAQVSYRRLDNTYDKAMSVYERLGVGGSKIHASPFEHIATPMEHDYWNPGTTHKDACGELWSGNMKGWVQYRQILPNHTCWNYKGDVN